MKFTKKKRPADQIQEATTPQNRWTSYRHRDMVLFGMICILTIGIYGSSLKNGFILTWDDHAYIISNDAIKSLSFTNILSIFTTFYAANYHPFTTFSWAVEFSLFGLNPLAYHVTNLVLHVINIWLVSRFVFCLTKRTASAGIVALFFAVHPLNVEVVAFVSQRKDVLYTMFFFLSINRYMLYKEKSLGKSHLLLCFFFFLCSLLAKSMAVTLPLVLLLIDWYQGHRLEGKTLVPKTPFFLLSLLFGIVAIFSQQSYGAIDAIPDFNFIDRFFLVNYAIIFYVAKLIVPVHLAAMHGYPLKTNGFLPLYCYASPFLVGIAGWAMWKLKRHGKMVVFGSLFFLITVAPVLQIVPVGGTLVSERYMYVPGIGLFFLLSTAGIKWFDKLQSSSRNSTSRLVALTCCIALLFSVISFNRTKVWADSDTLWSDVITKNSHVAVAYYNRGVARFNQREYKKAIEDYNRAIAIHPRYVEAIRNRGESKEKLQDYEGAIRDYDEIISLAPDDKDTYMHRALAKERQKDYDGAIKDLDFVIRNDNDNGKARLRRARLKSKVHAYSEAVQDFDHFIALYPNDAVAFNNRGIVKALMKNYQGAIKDFESAISLKPDYVEAIENRNQAKKYLQQ